MFPDGKLVLDHSDPGSSWMPILKASRLGDGFAMPPDALPVLLSAAPSAIHHHQHHDGRERQQEP